MPRSLITAQAWELTTQQNNDSDYLTIFPGIVGHIQVLATYDLDKDPA